MGQLVMSFRGLCIHVSPGPWLQANVAERVVLVDASQGADDVWGQLPPHFCFIEAHDSVLGLFEAAGLPREPAGISLQDHWLLTIENAVADQPVSIDLGGAPSLTHFSPGMELRPDLGVTGPPQDAACFFDIDAGAISPFVFPEGGICETWTVATHGEPRLRLRSRGGQDLTVTLPSTPPGTVQSDNVPGSFVLHNSTKNNEDSSNDFVLNYIARLGGIPDTLVQPFPGEQQASVFSQNFNTTQSCSNSTYP